MNALTCWTPEGLNPVAHFRHVGFSYETSSPAMFTCEMSVDGFIKQISSFEYLRNGFSKAWPRGPEIRVQG